ncbi:MAG: copper amine oxidase N-terminal domain-containing protein, partial [Peptococcaceae bacterium]|nr:copper amine oxidase N-terminal domain-containing protein [Peptococcaceae bacterium]
TANFKDKVTEPEQPGEPGQTKTYVVNVIYGEGDGSYEAGKLVTIKADPAPAGKTFDKWLILKGDIKLANENAAEITFVMPDMDVEVQAQYKTKSSGGSGGGGIGGGGAINGGSDTPSDKEDTAQDTIESVPNVIILTIGKLVAKVDGKDVLCDVAPLIKDGRTYTPARFIAELLGAKVSWNGAKQLVTVTKDDTVIEMKIGSSVAKVNGKAVEMGAAAFIKDGRTYTPARFVAKQLGANVDWNKTTRQVTITRIQDAK